MTDFIFDFLFDMMLVIGAISLFKIVMGFFAIRKLMKMHKDNPNVQGISIVNGEVKVIEKGDLEKVEEPIKDLVTDPICHREIEKKDAYRIVKDGVEYFFCSWDCREAFLKGEQSISK